MTDISEILFAQDAPAPQPEPPKPLAEFADDMGDCLDVDTLLAVEKLSPREVRFLTEYIEHGVVKRAAKAAGYPASYDPIKSTKHVRAAVVAVQRSLAAKFKYDAAAAFKDIDAAMQFARDTGSAMALVRAIELKTKIAGHAEQKVTGKITHDHTHEIVDSRTDAELRAHAERLAQQLGLHKPAPEAIDAEFTEIKPE